MKKHTCGPRCPVCYVKNRQRVERAAPDLLAACRDAYSVLSLLPSRGFWNPDDAADFFKGTYGKKMREKFEIAWCAIEIAVAKAEGRKL